MKAWFKNNSPLTKELYFDIRPAAKLKDPAPFCRNKGIRTQNLLSISECWVDRSILVYLNGKLTFEDLMNESKNYWKRSWETKREKDISMLTVQFISCYNPEAHSALSRSTWRPFGSERLDMSFRPELKPKGSSTCLTTEGLSTGSWPRGSVGVIC